MTIVNVGTAKAPVYRSDKYTIVRPINEHVYEVCHRCRREDHYAMMTIITKSRLFGESKSEDVCKECATKKELLRLEIECEY